MMRMKRFMRSLAVAAFVLLFSGCDVTDDGPSFHYVILQISDVDVPASFQLNGTYEIGVTYLLPGGCTKFEGFEVNKESYTTRQVVAVGLEFDELACTQEVEEVQTSFEFVCLYNQPYLFRFYSGTGADGAPQYIEVEVPVE